MPKITDLLYRWLSGRYAATKQQKGYDMKTTCDRHVGSPFSQADLYCSPVVGDGNNSNAKEEVWWAWGQAGHNEKAMPSSCPYHGDAEAGWARAREELHHNDHHHGHDKNNNSRGTTVNTTTSPPFGRGGNGNGIMNGPHKGHIVCGKNGEVADNSTSRVRNAPNTKRTTGTDSSRSPSWINSENSHPLQPSETITPPRGNKDSIEGKQAGCDNGFLVCFFASSIGTVIVVCAIILRIPQIVTCLRHRNANRMNGNVKAVLPYLVNTYSYAISASWGIAKGLPLSCYGEHLILFIQIICADFVIGLYQRKQRGNTGNVAFTMDFFFLFLAVALSFEMSFIPCGLHEILLYGKIFAVLFQKICLLCASAAQREAAHVTRSHLKVSLVLYCVRLMTTWVEVGWDAGKLPILLLYVFSAAFTSLLIVETYSDDETRKRESQRKKEASVGFKIRKVLRGLKEEIKKLFSATTKATTMQPSIM